MEKPKYRNMEREEVICLVRGHDYLYITADFSKEGEEKIKSVMTTKMLEDLFTMSCSLMGLSADPKESLTSTPINKEDYTKSRLTRKRLKELFIESDIVHFNGRDLDIDDADDWKAVLYAKTWEEGVTIYYDDFLKDLPNDLAFYKVQKSYPNEEEK